MLISFSERPMLPYIRAGIRQALGEDVGNERVKRQTYRADGKRADRLLRWDPAGHTIALPLHLVRVYAIEIKHQQNLEVRIAGPASWRQGGAIYWSPGRVGCADFTHEAHSDGFGSPEAFRDYFVPNPGDRFKAILFKW